MIEPIERMRKLVNDNLVMGLRFQMNRELNELEREIEQELNSRAERTCKFDYERHCSNCGVYVHTSAVLVRKDLDGGTWTVVSKPVNYCPNCGAKVVGE